MSIRPPPLPIGRRKRVIFYISFHIFQKKGFFLLFGAAWRHPWNKLLAFLPIYKQEAVTMTMTFTQKETILLNDLKSHEQICIKKYQTYSNQAQDPELKQLFTYYAGQEQQHLNTLNQISTGQVPSMNQQGQQGQQQNQQQSTQNVQPGAQAGTVNQNDASLCNDVLVTEKYISGAYNTAIFEFRDANVRQALNHIQKEEQQHGEGVFNYMQKKGMYNVQ
jgi:spore coat protein CotF